MEQKPMVGYAATVTCRTAIPPRAGDAYHQLTHRVERFSELSGPPVAAATFGEIMCTTYQTFGAAGLVTTGTIASHGNIPLLKLHVPLHVGCADGGAAASSGSFHD